MSGINQSDCTDRIRYIINQEETKERNFTYFASALRKAMTSNDQTNNATFFKKITQLGHGLFIP